MKSALLEKLSHIGLYWQNTNFVAYTRLSFIFIVFQIVILVSTFNQLPPEVPMFFSSPWGDSQLTKSSNLILLPIFSFLIVIINFSISTLITQQRQLFAHILAVSSVVFSLLSTLALFNIIFLVS